MQVQNITHCATMGYTMFTLYRVALARAQNSAGYRGLLFTRTNGDFCHLVKLRRIESITSHHR